METLEKQRGGFAHARKVGWHMGLPAQPDEAESYFRRLLIVHDAVGDDAGFEPADWDDGC